MIKLAKQAVKFYVYFVFVTAAFAVDNETTPFLSQVSRQQFEVAGNMTTYSASVVNATPGTLTDPTAKSTEMLTKLNQSAASDELVRHSFARGLVGPHYHDDMPHYHQPDSRWGPFFEEGPEPYNVSAMVGSTVIIDCRIGLLQDKMVTWLRHKSDSIHVLTVGRNAYSSDDRVTLNFRYPNNFRLAIAFVTSRDEGLYECQVATHPPRVKKVYIKITAPIIRILDDVGRVVTERYYKAGSNLELMCIITQVGVLYEEHPIFWRHVDRILTKGISTNMSNATDSAVSILIVGPLQRHHSGNYTCEIGTLASATVTVHVLNGELPAAVHHGNDASANRFASVFFPLTVACMVVKIR